ncbi:MAG: biotin/lipoyl-binding protein, partial [Holophagales bacterium]|nr:biotin/lipoyl-binding protein [Holophagales bacterium]
MANTREAEEIAACRRVAGPARGTRLRAGHPRVAPPISRSISASILPSAANGAALLILMLSACSSEVVPGDGAEGTAGVSAAETGSEAGAQPAAAAGDESEEAVRESARARTKRRERAASVRVAEAVRRDLVVPVHAEGSIRARYSADLIFELGGRVQRVHVREGQRVRKGQPLVTLDARELRLAHEEAEARYLKALGQLAVEEEGYEGQEGAERRLAGRAEELQRLEDAGEISRRERLDRELEIGMDAVRAGAYRRELMEVRSGLSAARTDAERL